jgi:hypothetical protein
MWPKLAGYVGVKAEGFEGSARPPEEQMQGMDHIWAKIAATHGLAEADLARVASWWHTDADLGRNIEVLADMSKSRLAGFSGYRRTEDCFRRLFDRDHAEKIIP